VSEPNPPQNELSADNLLSEEELERLKESLSSSAQRDPLSLAVPRFKLVREIGPRTQPRLVHPFTVTLEAGGNILAIDHPCPECFRLCRFTPDGDGGTALAEFPKGGGDTELLDPTRFAVDIKSQVYILDSQAGAVKKFTLDGRWIDTFSTAGSSGTPLSDPSDLDIDSAGNIYLADTNNDRVVQLLPNGEVGWVIDCFDRAQEPDDLYEPRSVRVAANGAVYVADSNNNRVVRFGPERRLAAILGNGKRFTFPTRVRLSADGSNVYVADNGDTRVQRFNDLGEKTACLLLGGGGREADFGGGADFDVDAEGHIVMINLLRESIVILDFMES